MENTELVFDTLNNMSFPMLLLELSKTKDFTQLYSNKSMQDILNKKPTDTKYATSLNALINNYIEESHTGSFMINNIDIFDAVYNVHFDAKEKCILVIFVKIPISEVLNSITYHNISEVFSSIMIVLESSGNIIDVNDYFLKLMEIKKESVLGKNFFETFMPAYIEKLNPYLQNIILKDNYAQHFVTPLTASSGKNYRINWQVSKIIKSEQTYIIAVGSDITRYVEENKDLKLKLTSIRVGFDYFPLAVGYMNASGKFITMNPRFKEIFDIVNTNKKIMFDEIFSLTENASFDKIKEYIGLIKEMSYNMNYDKKGKLIKLKVDIRLLDAKKKSSNFYIVVVQKIK